MTAKLYNLARMTVSSGGAGSITLGAAVTGFLTFALSGVRGNDIITYAINDPGLTPVNSEVGRATYLSSNTSLTSRQVLSSTNGNAAINVSANAHVFICPTREDFAGDWCSTHANLGGL